MSIRDFTTTVIQDGVEWSAGALRDAADRVAEVLARFSSGRVAVVGRRVDVLVPALLACESVGCELLLLREQPPDIAVPSPRWGIDAIVSDELEVKRLRALGDAPAGFAVLLTTSGTTGTPKVARHAAERLMGLVRVPGPGYRVPIWLLTYHPASFAGVQVLLTALTGGAPRSNE